MGLLTLGCQVDIFVTIFFSRGRKRKVAFLMHTAQCSVQGALRAHSKFARRFNNGTLFLYCNSKASYTAQYSGVVRGMLKGLWPPGIWRFHSEKRTEREIDNLPPPPRI